MKKKRTTNVKPSKNMSSMILAIVVIILVVIGIYYAINYFIKPGIEPLFAPAGITVTRTIDTPIVYPNENIFVEIHGDIHEDVTSAMTAEETLSTSFTGFTYTPTGSADGEDTYSCNAPGSLVRCAIFPTGLGQGDTLHNDVTIDYAFKITAAGTYTLDGSYLFDTDPVPINIQTQTITVIANEPTETICDGRDNDGDGYVDEALTRPTAPCGQGQCAGNTGTEACYYGLLSGGNCVEYTGDLATYLIYPQTQRCGEWEVTVPCDPTAGATPEQCDAIDHDCDGNNYNGFTAETCEDVCLANGGADYNSGRGSGLKCCGDNAGEDSPFEANEQTCDDGNDNDCDGLTDRTSPDPDCGVCDPGDVDYYPSQQGVCSGVFRTCGSNSQWGPYNLPTTFEDPETSCDNLDNDCDGSTDEVPNECTAMPNVDYVCDSSTQTCVCGSQWNPDLGTYDGNCDGCVDIGELVWYLGLWKNGDTTITDAAAQITNYLGGSRC